MNKIALKKALQRLLSECKGNGVALVLRDGKVVGKEPREEKEKEEVKTDGDSNSRH